MKIGIEGGYGDVAPDFSLPGTTGLHYALADLVGEAGLVVAFICNHCPYVKAVADRMAEDARQLAAEGLGFVAISSNDATAYPEDSFGRMSVFAERHDFAFPYLYDESQEVARAYGAQCTPEFFGLNKRGEICYHGRLDEGAKGPLPSGGKRELVEAMRQIALTGSGPKEQIASVGCSIKWRTE